MINRRSDIKTQHLVVLYTKQHLSSCEISDMTGMSRSAIMKRIKGAGVNVHDVIHISSICDFCGSPIEVIRSAWKKSVKHYCNPACYYANLENPGYYQWRHGQRLARALVAHYIHLEPDNIVHHKDSNNHNNNLNNLQVFASHADHMAHERGNTTIKPIWQGSLVSTHQ